MYLKELWRFPVKSLAGERLRDATLGWHGFEGDRVVQVRRGDRLVTARTVPRLLSLRATLGPDGVPLVDGVPWHSESAARTLQEIAGDDASYVFDDSPLRFDMLPLLVATDGGIEAFGRDGRRLRPNLVIGGVEGLTERTWDSKLLRVGTAVIGLHSLRKRCVMVNFDPDTQEADPDVLRDVHRRFNGFVALDGWVLEPGLVREGDTVEVEPLEEEVLETAGPHGRFPSEFGVHTE